MIPNFVQVGIDTPHFHWPGIWLPLFLLWIPLLLLAPLVLIGLAVAAVYLRTTVWRMVGLGWGLLSGLRGVDIRVEADGHRVLVRLA